jgi:subtilase family serine protease
MLTVRDELYQYGSTADIATIEYPIPGQQADLTITEIENGRTVRRGAFLPVTITIENLDWATATGNVWNTIYFSDDTVISSDDHRMAIVDITNMPGKTSRTYEVELQIWGSIPLGEYYIYAIADEQEIIDESDETNNVLFSPTTVTIKEQNRFH